GQNTDWSSQVELARSKVAATMQALNRRMIALLPQGTPASQFTPSARPGDQFQSEPPIAARPGTAPDGAGAVSRTPERGFDTGAFISEALAKLVPSPLAKLPPRGPTVLAAHSEGGHAASTILTEEGKGKLPAALGEVILFDAINDDNALERVEEWLTAQWARD